MSYLYHIAETAAWDAAGADYIPEAYAREGFIHLSYAHQRRLTQQRYYRERDDLVLLTIEPGKLSHPVRVENGFPHLYGPLPAEAVVASSPLPAYRDLTVALLSATYPNGAPDLAGIDAELVVLPELPLNPWSPASRITRDADVDDWRDASLREAAVSSGKALLGGVIRLHDGERRNTARLWGPDGQLWLSYEKMHLPHEEGFWEGDHYRPGSEPPRVTDAAGFPLGVQLCSDTNLPFGAMALRAQGAAAILIPRATEATTFPRWRRIFQALAQITACYVLSVTRPEPEGGVALGGPSIVVGPDGEVVYEGTDRVVHATLEHRRVVAARDGYPGYLAVPVEAYANGWSRLGSELS